MTENTDYSPHERSMARTCTQKRSAHGTLTAATTEGDGTPKEQTGKMVPLTIEVDKTQEFLFAVLEEMEAQRQLGIITAKEFWDIRSICGGVKGPGSLFNELSASQSDTTIKTVLSIAEEFLGDDFNLIHGNLALQKTSTADVRSLPRSKGSLGGEKSRGLGVGVDNFSDPMSDGGFRYGIDAFQSVARKKVRKHFSDGHIDGSHMQKVIGVIDIYCRSDISFDFAIAKIESFSEYKPISEELKLVWKHFVGPFFYSDKVLEIKGGDLQPQDNIIKEGVLSEDCLQGEFDFVGSIIRGPDGLLYCEIDGERRILAEFAVEAASKDPAGTDAQTLYLDEDGGIEVPVDDDGMPLRAPELWKDRKTGREVTPVDFIRKYYGPWLGGGGSGACLSRAVLHRLDLPLYNAYVARIRRQPTEDLKLPTEARETISDPAQAMERRRRLQRDAKRLKSALHTADMAHRTL